MYDNVTKTHSLDYTTFFMNAKHFIAERDPREYVGSTLLITLRPREVAKGHRALPLYLPLPNVWKLPSQKKKKIALELEIGTERGNFSPFLKDT